MCNVVSDVVSDVVCDGMIDFKQFGGFGNRRTDRQMDKRTLVVVELLSQLKMENKSLFYKTSSSGGKLVTIAHIKCHVTKC